MDAVFPLPQGRERQKKGGRYGIPRRRTQLISNNFFLPLYMKLNVYYNGAVSGITRNNLHGGASMNEKENNSRQDGRGGRPLVDQERRLHVGQVIRRYRVKAGLDQAQLAGRLGFTKTAVASWEVGRTRPDIDTVPRLCSALGVPVTELLGLPVETALPDEEKNLLHLYRSLDGYGRRTVTGLMDRLLFLQDTREKEHLRRTYRPLCLYEEAAAAGVGAPMQDEVESRTVYALESRIPGGADTVIHVNGTSMEPTFPNGSYVFVRSGPEISLGQIGIFLVNGEVFIKEYRREGLVSHNKRFRTISIGEDTDVRCFGRVMGPVEDGDIAAGSLLEKIEAAFEDSSMDDAAVEGNAERKAAEGAAMDERYAQEGKAGRAEPDAEASGEEK